MSECKEDMVSVAMLKHMLLSLNIPLESDDAITIAELLHDEVSLNTLTNSDDVLDVISDLITLFLPDEDENEVSSVIWNAMVEKMYVTGVEETKESDMKASDSESSTNDEDDTVNGEGSEDDFLEDGLCLICERDMPLTKHHLIPRELHQRMKKQGWKTKVLVKCIDICRQCHSRLHQIFTNQEMARDFHTMETIMGHPDVQKWIPFIRKQKVRHQQHGLRYKK